MQWEVKGSSREIPEVDSGPRRQAEAGTFWNEMKLHQTSQVTKQGEDRPTEGVGCA